jgi:hypothetical protein
VPYLLLVLDEGRQNRERLAILAELALVLRVKDAHKCAQVVLERFS